MVLGGHNVSPAKRAAQLFLDEYANYLVFSGGFGKLTKNTFDKTEAETFADIAIDMGVAINRIVLETKSTNTGENILYTYALLESKEMLPSSILLVVKPFFERRAYATFEKQWQDPDVEVLVTSPQVSYDEYFAHNTPSEKSQIINVMVGDFQRIAEYPKLGLQVEQEIPNGAWKAYEALLKAGYTRHLITSS